MTPIPGPFAPTVTQHVAGAPTRDAHNTEVPGTPTDRPVRVLAQFPGNTQETDNATGDQVLADLVLLVDSSLTVAAADEWTATDGFRYRAMGDPRRYRHPVTGTAVTQVNLRRVG